MRLSDNKMYLVRTPNAAAAKGPGYSLQSFLRRPTKKDFPVRTGSSGRTFLSPPERVHPGGPYASIRKSIGCCNCKMVECIGILLKFTGDLPAVIAYKLVFSEISTTAAASDTETTKLQPYAYWYKIDARHFLLSNYPF